MDDNKKVTEVIKVIAEREICGKQFRVWGTFDNPLFLAKDVALCLGYIDTKGNAGNSLIKCTSLNDNEKIKKIASLPKGTSYQKRPAWFLTESGFYKAVMKSNKPEAEPFKDWVCDEVLPCIRKHGYYSKEQARLDKILKVTNIVENENYMIEGVR